MRKRILNKEELKQHLSPCSDWLNLDEIVQVELTSEDHDYPIESALLPGNGKGWRAAQSGAQSIRLLFSKPMTIKCIHLEFQEEGQERIQEFNLRWSDDGGRAYREIVRQQFNFNPVNATTEVEDYQVDLDGVDALELNLVPDISGHDSYATLKCLKLA